MGRIVRDKQSIGRTVHGTNSPWDEQSMGRTVHGTNSPRDEQSGTNSPGTKHPHTRRDIHDYTYTQVFNYSISSSKNQTESVCLVHRTPKHGRNNRTIK